MNKKILVIGIVAIVIISIFSGIFLWVIFTQNEEEPYYKIVIYEPSKVFNGRTLFSDGYDPNNPKIVEVNMLGEIIWEYYLPDNLSTYTNPGLESEHLSNGNVMIVLPRYGIIIINKTTKNIVKQYRDDKISHDADRLPNGNFIYIWGVDNYTDPQVKEINSSGHIVWSWRAYDFLYNDTYKNLYNDGWTHANSVTRLKNNNTIISLRNFNTTIEVNKTGDIVWEYNWTSYGTHPHEPEILPNGNLIIGLQHDPVYHVAEINRTTGDVVWNFTLSGLRTVRDADRLPNNNSLIQGVLEAGQESTIIEVSEDGEIVWQLNLKNAPANRSPGWFYRAQRIPA